MLVYLDVMLDGCRFEWIVCFYLLYALGFCTKDDSKMAYGFMDCMV